MNTISNKKPHVKLLKKLHRWPGFIAALFLLYYSITGIVMNHREIFAGIDISRKCLPKNYEYNNWNNAAIKGTITLPNKNILWFGSVGIWQSDSATTFFTKCTNGIPVGSDNERTFDVHLSKKGNLYAGTLFGLYTYDSIRKTWNQINIENNGERISAIESKNDTLYIVSRSHILIGYDNGIKTTTKKITLSTPKNEQRSISLFKTLWHFHSGEIFGLPGKLFVDLLGIITAFLSITGIVYFLFPSIIKRRKAKQKEKIKIIALNKWSLRWHNYFGRWTFIALIILFASGIFLRPPLLIAIAKTEITPLKYSHIDQPNSWYDNLRDMTFDSTRNCFFISTSKGMYTLKNMQSVPEFCQYQPPISVMGINVFKQLHDGSFLIGSFAGLFIWNPESPLIYNYLTGQLYRESSGGRPVGDYKITGIANISNTLIPIDYDQGMLLPFNSKKIDMPQSIQEHSTMSLWNVSLEIHTGRFFENILGLFYILIVPISGLLCILVTISGYLIWRRKYNNKKSC